MHENAPCHNAKVVMYFFRYIRTSTILKIIREIISKPLGYTRHWFLKIFNMLTVWLFLLSNVLIFCFSKKDPFYIAKLESIKTEVYWDNKEPGMKVNNLIKGFGKLLDHGGVVMYEPIIYLVFYGKQWNMENSKLLSLLSNSFSSEPFMRYMKSVFLKPGMKPPILNISLFVEETKSLDSLDSHKEVIKSLIQNGLLPLNTNGIYFLLPDSQVSQTFQRKENDMYGYSWCGYHSNFLYENTFIKYVNSNCYK
jgi:hypothetical protein